MHKLKLSNANEHTREPILDRAWLEGRIEFENSNLLFTPEMNEDADNALGQILHDIVENILTSSALVGRIADISISQQFGNVESQQPALPAVNEESAEAEAEEESAKLTSAASFKETSMPLVKPKSRRLKGFTRPSWLWNPKLLFKAGSVLMSSR